MPLPAWSPAWCPGCNALVVQWVVALLPPPERHSWLESDYLVCPRCEAVTVSLPACTPVRAYTSLVAMGRSRWSRAGLTELQRAVGLAKGFGQERSSEAIEAIAGIAPPLTSVIRDAVAAGQLSNALLTLGVILDMLQSGLRGGPRARSRAAETRQVSELIEELRRSLADVLAETEDLERLEGQAGAAEGDGGNSESSEDSEDPEDSEDVLRGRRESEPSR